MEIGDVQYIGGCPYVYFGKDGKDVEHFVGAPFHEIESSNYFEIVGRIGDKLLGRSVPTDSEEHSRLIKQLEERGLKVR